MNQRTSSATSAGTKRRTRYLNRPQTTDHRHQTRPTLTTPHNARHCLPRLIHTACYRITPGVEPRLILPSASTPLQAETTAETNRHRDSCTNTDSWLLGRPQITANTWLISRHRASTDTASTDTASTNTAAPRRPAPRRKARNTPHRRLIYCR